MAISPPFGSPPVLSFVSSSGYNSALAKLAKYPQYAGLNVMLVDLTGQPKKSIARGSMGTYNGAPTRYIASVGKVAAMFAAFRLRKNFREAAAESSSTKADDLRAEVTAAWKPHVEHAISGAADFPNLKAIFDVSGSHGNWTISFTDSFYKKMEEMIGPSSNSAASHCILNLGYQYINGALAAEGFYKSGSGGLWLTGDYSKGRDGPADPVSKSHQAGNVLALAQLITACSNQALVKDSASSQMRRMMNNAFMFRILRDLKRPISPTSFGKLGIGSDGTYHDASLIERSTADGVSLRYVAIILGSKGSGGLWGCGEFIDDIVADMNSP